MGLSNEEFVLPSGSKLYISMPSFKEASALFRAIMRSQKGGSLSKEQMATDLALSVWSSDEVEDKLFDCLSRATYNGIKITKALFDDPNNGEKVREDYFPICSKAIEFILRPFLAQTFSGSVVN